MAITPEMQEILNLLEKRNDYIIFAGFAGYLHTGVETSADIDVFVPIKEVDNISKQLRWTETKRTTSQNAKIITLEKNKTTFDVIGINKGTEPYFETKVEHDFNGKKLWIMSKEALLLSKMNQVTAEDRTEAKTSRDRKVIAILRSKIDLKKIRELATKLSDEFWQKGWF